MRLSRALLCATLAVVPAGALRAQQTPPAAPPAQAAASPTDKVLAQAGQEGKFTFLVFQRSNDAATQALTQSLQQGLGARAEQAVIAPVNITDPAESALVARFGFGRAPMPLVASIGPNGALTGVFPRQITAQNINDAFVPPTMLSCMKHLQQGKLVFVCVHSGSKADIPQGVQQFQTNPEFAQRTSMVTVSASDPKEARLIQQVQLHGQQINGTKAALIAPPGVLVGQFDANNSWQQIATALHKAGQCCNDPNCKHNH